MPNITHWLGRPADTPLILLVAFRADYRPHSPYTTGPIPKIIPDYPVSLSVWLSKQTGDSFMNLKLCESSDFNIYMNFFILLENVLISKVLMKAGLLIQLIAISYRALIRGLNCPLVIISNSNKSKDILCYCLTFTELSKEICMYLKKQTNTKHETGI